MPGHWPQQASICVDPQRTGRCRPVSGCKFFATNGWPPFTSSLVSLVLLVSTCQTSRLVSFSARRIQFFKKHHGNAFEATANAMGVHVTPRRFKQAHEAFRNGKACGVIWIGIEEQSLMVLTPGIPSLFLLHARHSFRCFSIWPIVTCLIFTLAFPNSVDGNGASRLAEVPHLRCFQH